MALICCTLREDAEAALTCYDCHGTKNSRDIRPEDASSRNPATGGISGNHRTHMGEGSDAAACSRCHPGSSGYTSSHRDGFIKLAPNINMSPQKAVYKDSTSAFPQTSTPSPGNCTNVNCHFEKMTPQWGSTPLSATGNQTSTGDCKTCHNAPPSDGKHEGKHSRYYGGGTFVCRRCHPDHPVESKPFAHATSAGHRQLAVQFTAAPNSGGSYLNGSINYPDYLRSQSPRNGTCTNYCHSDGLRDSGGKAGPATIALSWSDTKSSQCISCHKGRTFEDNTPTNCSAIGGSWDAIQGLCSPDLTMSSNGHHRLVGPQWIRKYPCNYCHYATVGSSDSMSNLSSLAIHVNGVPNVAINPRWNIVGRPDPVYNATKKTCDNIYCHSDGTTDPDQVKEFAWNDKDAKCNVCHGHPLGSCSTNGCHDGKLHPATATESARVWPLLTDWAPGKEWMSAIPMFPNQGVGTARANSHPRHVQSDYACDECHAATIKSNGNCPSCHAGGLPSGVMSEVSHLDGAFHVNKIKDVFFKRGGTYNSDKSCSNTACHKDGADPVWGGSVGAQVVCKNCHGTNGSDVDTSITTGGSNAKINLTEWATTGHGRYSTSGRYPVSKNPAANFPGDNACWYCHDNTVYHNDPNNVFRLRQHSQFSRRFEGECVYCHMTRTQSECLGCHNNGESMAPQLANLSSSHSATARWPDGTAVIRPDHRSYLQNGDSCLSDQNSQCHSSDQKTHNTGAGIWREDQKADVKNQYVMMGVCLQCHDDDTGSKCASCHDYNKDPVKYPPARYDLGFNGGSGKIKPKKARASSVHFGYKHYNDFLKSGGWTKVYSPVKSTQFGTYSAYQGTWKGGKFCWDCHDPHGDKNIYMIHDQVATSTDGRFGIPYTRAAVSFTSTLSGTDYAKTSAPYNGICNVCHSPDSKHYRADGGDGHNSGSRCTNCHEHRFTDSHADDQPCNRCHLNKPVPRHSAFGQPRDCTKCHAQTIGNRTDVMNSQFAGNSHHIQGVAVNSKQCYACHWEATPEGLIDVRYHKGYNYLNYSSTPNSRVDLVIWGAGVRPTVYKLYSTATQFLASNVSSGVIATERTEIAQITPHCISCHSDQNNNTQPFGDCKTPRQYAWDKQSISARYSQTGTTPWGKYPSNGKSSLTKAFSAHGNAVANQGGYNTSTGIDSNINNSRNGLYNVQCFDCHNSHGSRVVGTTSSYLTFNGTKNGANLKETQAGKGGYKYNYKAKANGSDAINPYKEGGGQCFDCHMNAAQNAIIPGIDGYRTPWGYQTTFGASMKILGYLDSPWFGQDSTGYMLRYPYKTLPITGGHLKASGFLNHTTSAQNRINGLCTPCHDPHGITPALGSKQAYAVPMLKGTWMTSPNKEDVANPGQGGGAQSYVDLGGVAEDSSKFAGLCIRCHSKGNLTNSTNHEWKSQDRVHESVKGWKSANGNANHGFACSKCHAPHTSGLKRLMITNCLNTNHQGRVVSGTPTLEDHNCDTYWNDGSQTGCSEGSFPTGAYEQNCHPTGSWPDNTWNRVTPW
ncbi:MAG: CxxxxCH/CxxCH domain-containing protein [Geobacteraceae bacterium]|nr:CxxxxCH/CxxCH domain-containing protein [Geobacteraceae bacterium]